MAANLYRTFYLNSLGYVVYRHCFDEGKCRMADGVLAHKQAVFVDEVAALHYCRYRNCLIDRNGSDVIFVEAH